jgi:hypothetical protein
MAGRRIALSLQETNLDVYNRCVYSLDIVGDFDDRADSIFPLETAFQIYRQVSREWPGIFKRSPKEKFEEK